MKAGNVVIALVVLLAGSSVVQAFSFCFSAGGSNNNRTDFYRRPPPAAGFGPGIYQAHPYSPVYAAPGRGAYYMPPPVLPQYELPSGPDQGR